MMEGDGDIEGDGHNPKSDSVGGGSNPISNTETGPVPAIGSTEERVTEITNPISP